MWDQALWAMPPSPLLASLTAGGGVRQNVFVVLMIAGFCLTVLALAIHVVRKRRRDRYVREILTLQRRMEGSAVESFTSWRRPEVKAPSDDEGVPRTIVSEGRYVFTQSGEMLRFSSSLEEDSDGYVEPWPSRPVVPGATGEGATASVPFILRRLVALHRSGVAIVAVDSQGRVERGDDLEPDLLVVLEDLLDMAIHTAQGASTGSYGMCTVRLRAGSPFHLGAVVDGEPDEVLDRELRWAQGDLGESLGDNPVGDADGHRRLSFLTTLVHRLSDVFAINRGATAPHGRATTRDGGFIVTTNIALRRGLLEVMVGLSNRGPGTAYDVKVLPNVGPEGVAEIVSSHGVEVDHDGLFSVPDIVESRKALATFVFRPNRTGAIKVECTVILLRGVADVQDVRPPARWVELEGVQTRPGEHVEPERVLEIALQPAAFSDCMEIYVPSSGQSHRLIQSVVDALRMEMRLVVQLEDPSIDRTEAWFFTELVGGANLVACISSLPTAGVIGLFVAATVRNPIPATLLRMRESVGRAAGVPLVDALEGSGPSGPCGGEFMLRESWGHFGSSPARGPRLAPGAARPTTSTDGNKGPTLLSS